MGGQRTEVTVGTKHVLLEAAVFDSATVRKMAKRHNLRSEASARYERGLPVQLTPIGLNRALELFKEEALVSGNIQITDQLQVWPWVQRLGLRRTRLNKLLGQEVTFKEAIDALSKLGIQSSHFDIVKEAKQQLGKPYIWGASFKTHGLEGFDCGFLTDYLYSLIGVWVGHTGSATDGLRN